MFVEKRLITDNFIISFEDFHSLNNGKINGANYFSLKLDLSKAFYKVEWNFLESIILAMKFPANTPLNPSWLSD